MAEKNIDKPQYKKAPGFYKKTLTPEQLEKFYLKYIEQPSDKNFIKSCYAADGEQLNVKENLGVEEVKHLKVLKAAIKKNRKIAVNMIPIVVVAAIIAGLVFFFTVLANPLLQRALERGLEEIFEARVNADRFRLSLLRFEIGMNGLTIADRDAPMKNLIQFSKMKIKMKPEAVLRGKIYIEEVRADSIRFGTDRSVSGAIPGRILRSQRVKEEKPIPPLVDLKNFDPLALLNQEYEKLQTPKLYNAVWEAYDSALAKWKGERENAMVRIAELQARAEPFLKINVNDFRTLDANTISQIRTIVEEINALTATVQTAQNDVNRMVSGAQDDINTARSLEQGARNAFTSDFNHLRSYIDLGSGALAEVVEAVVWSILTDSAYTYIAYGERALEVLEKVKAIQAKLPKSSPKPAKAAKFQGRDVVFPSRQYPKFFMGILATDVLTPNDWQWDFDLRAVSSDPDISDRPTSLALSLAETGDGLNRSGAFRGQADFRTSAKERFNAELQGGGFPVDLSANLSQIGIGGFSGGASFSISAAGNTDGGFSGGGTVSLAQAKLTNPANTFAQAADEAIRNVRTVDLGIKYEHVVSGKDHFAVTTNFGNILKDAMARIVAQYRRQAEAALERELRSRIEQYIDGRFIGKEDLDAVFALMRGDKNAADNLKNTLDRKKAELETRLRSAADSAVEEAKSQGQQAIQDIIQGRPPSTPSLPNIPGFPRP